MLAATGWGYDSPQTVWAIMPEGGTGLSVR